MYDLLYTLIKSRLHNSLLTFITLCLHTGLLVICTLLNSNFFKCHTWILSLVSVLLATVHSRYGMKSM